MRLKSIRALAALTAGLFGSLLPAGAADLGTVYLTFDDGPLHGTANALAVIQEKRVPAAFFMVGNHVEADRNTLRWFEAVAAEPLATLANHSYSHANDNYRGFYRDGGCAVADFRRGADVLGLTGWGIHTRLPGRNTTRLPGLVRNDTAWPDEREVYDLIGYSGFRVYGWDLEWHRSGGAPRESAGTMVAAVVSLLKSGRTMVPGKVMLLTHDVQFRTRSGRSKLAQFIDGLKKHGVGFGRIEDYGLDRPAARPDIAAREPKPPHPPSACDAKAAGMRPPERKPATTLAASVTPVVGAEE
jgi:peptidoglycan/xylan/chitin deacetylase (PgdA/CDA1 family)